MTAVTRYFLIRMMRAYSMAMTVKSVSRHYFDKSILIVNKLELKTDSGASVNAY